MGFVAGPEPALFPEGGAALRSPTEFCPRTPCSVERFGGETRATQGIGAGAPVCRFRAPIRLNCLALAEGLSTAQERLAGPPLDEPETDQAGGEQVPMALSRLAHGMPVRSTDTMSVSGTSGSAIRPG
jgi:hypothetical protein